MQTLNFDYLTADVYYKHLESIEENLKRLSLGTMIVDLHTDQGKFLPACASYVAESANLVLYAWQQQTILPTASRDSIE